MDSQASGKNELLSIETSDFIFVLKGERFGKSQDAEFNIEAKNEGIINLLHEEG